MTDAEQDGGKRGNGIAKTAERRCSERTVIIMLSFIAGFFIGGLVGLIVTCVTVAGRDAEEKAQKIINTPIDEPLHREHDKPARSDYFDGFDPAPDFDPFCPAVCGNCAHWGSEIFAWGEQRDCKLSWMAREAGDVCNIRNGEVVEEEKG